MWIPTISERACSTYVSTVNQPPWGEAMTGRPLASHVVRGLVAAFSLACLLATAVATNVHAISPLTFTVNKTTDASDRAVGDAKCDTSTKAGNQCTLRAAIQEANHSAELDTIKFNITTTPRVIAPASPLPPITQAVTIDGYSQAGSSTNTKAVGNDAVLKITLDGINAGASADGLVVGGFKSTVRGLVIQRFKGSGIVLTGSSDKVYGNFVGTTANGADARSNGTGITITGGGGAVGSGATKDRNLISGNTGDGVHVNAGANN